MTNTHNGFSDSQESALLDEDAYKELEKEIGINGLPFLPTDIIEEPEEELEEMEQKYDTSTMHHSSQGKRSRNEESFSQNRENYEANFYPELEPTVPIKEEFPGHLNFEFLLCNQSTSKHWVYSEQLEKVFINMEQTLPIRFKWEPALDGLYLRTAMVFSLDQYRNDPVQRCHNHMAPSNRSNQAIDPRIIKHVVRCMDHSSSYDERNEHLSIVTPLRTPQPGSQYVPMYFKFFCKNSCPSGMNRRPTELVFTLEDHKNKVLGRRRLLVRVCSCPKRDKEKEESESVDTPPGAKRRKTSVPMGKKIVMPIRDNHEFEVRLKVPGKEIYLSVLKNAYDIMAGQAARSGQYEFFKPYMDDILHKCP